MVRKQDSQSSKTMAAEQIHKYAPVSSGMNRFAVAEICNGDRKCRGGSEFTLAARNGETQNFDPSCSRNRFEAEWSLDAILGTLVSQRFEAL
jgi:hypothetical protein